jgi:hypothetical protein
MKESLGGIHKGYLKSANVEGHEVGMSRKLPYVVACWVCVHVLVFFTLQNLEKRHLMNIDRIFFKALCVEKQKKALRIIDFTKIDDSS